MPKFNVSMSRYIRVKQVCREVIEAVDENEVDEIVAETDYEDWDWEDYDVMDTGEITLNSVTPTDTDNDGRGGDETVA